MRVAALYDIHGNLPALDAVLDDVREAGVDRIVVGGDVVPGPMPRETLDRLLHLDLPVQCIRGNGERDILARIDGVEGDAMPERYRPAMQWVAEQIDPAPATAMARWPATLQLDGESLGTILFCHATPRNDTELFTRLTPDNRLHSVFDGVDVAVVVCGHTHMQFDRTIGGTRVVNAGSVGMPFGEPGAYWVLLDHGVHLRRTAYDFAAAAAHIRATRYPLAEEFAAQNVLQPPSEATMLELFGRSALQ